MGVGGETDEVKLGVEVGWDRMEASGVVVSRLSMVFGFALNKESEWEFGIGRWELVVKSESLFMVWLRVVCLLVFCWLVLLSHPYYFLLSTYYCPSSWGASSPRLTGATLIILLVLGR